MSSQYDILKERNKREKFALDLTDLLIKKYFDKSEKEAVYVEYATDYNFKVVPQSTTGETDMLPKHTETPGEQWERYYLNL